MREKFNPKGVYVFEDYGIHRSKWLKIKEDVISNSLKSQIVKNKHELSDEQVWYLYDRLLQEKYNKLYKRPPIDSIQLNMYVYCDYEGFGRGSVVKIFKDEELMLVKFDKIDLPTMCSSRDKCTVHDEVKRKITRL